MGRKVWGLGFRVWSLSLGFRVLGCGASDLEFRLRVQGFGLLDFVGVPFGPGFVAEMVCRRQFLLEAASARPRGMS